MEMPSQKPSEYRGRLAPSPTGYLHLGHARTFWTARHRAREAKGTLILRNDDLDHVRCKPEFVAAMYEDLRWFGFAWQEGPDIGGPCAPYAQSERIDFHREMLRKLQAAGCVYACTCSRQDVLRALGAPHAGEDEPIYPGTCRPSFGEKRAIKPLPKGARINWRFKVPDGEAISFVDGAQGLQTFVAGRDFGDFVVWRHDDIPSYQLAVVADDAAMGITEVVRGADLLASTARQLLIYKALGLQPPGYYHCPLVTDETGIRLAKRHDALSLRTMRERGVTPESIRQNW